MFSSVLVNIFPLDLLYRTFFGPRSWSATMGDTVYCIDPHMVEVGRNVQLGFHCTLIGHLFDNRGMLLRKIVIEDHAVVGGESTLMPGVRVGHHSIIGVRSVVPAETTIPPYEYWAGTPARKVKNLTANDSAVSETPVGDPAAEAH
jgi:acetyltransferase-like isoleucine patch superfamily enzyme